MLRCTRAAHEESQLLRDAAVPPKTAQFVVGHFHASVHVALHANLQRLLPPLACDTLRDTSFSHLGDKQGTSHAPSSAQTVTLADDRRLWGWFERLPPPTRTSYASETITSQDALPSTLR